LNSAQSYKEQVLFYKKVKTSRPSSKVHLKRYKSWAFQKVCLETLIRFLSRTQSKALGFLHWVTRLFCQKLLSKRNL